MNTNETEIRIDNSRIELDSLLGAQSLKCELATVDFTSGTTVSEFWKAHPFGRYMLLIRSESQAQAVHIICLVNGVIKKANTAILKQPLLGAQHVISKEEQN